MKRHRKRRKGNGDAAMGEGRARETILAERKAEHVPKESPKESG